MIRTATIFIVLHGAVFGMAALFHAAVAGGF